MSQLTTAEAVAQADAVVEGSFQLNQTLSSSRNYFSGLHGQGLKVDTFVVPFQIDRAAKGPATGTLKIRLYFTFGANTPFRQGLPLKEKMLLLLRQDPQDKDTYTLFPKTPPGWSSPPALPLLPSVPRPSCWRRPRVSSPLAWTIPASAAESPI